MVVDWLAIRNDYINGGGSYREMAEKYGVSQSTIRKRAASEQWANAKEYNRNKIGTETEQKTQEKISEALSDEAAAKARIRLKLITMAEKWIDQHAKEEILEDTTDYRRIVQSCVDMGVFDDAALKVGDGREDDPLTKALKEEAERLQNGDID